MCCSTTFAVLVDRASDHKPSRVQHKQAAWLHWRTVHGEGNYTNGRERERESDRNRAKGERAGQRKRQRQGRDREAERQRSRETERQRDKEAEREGQYTKRKQQRAYNIDLPNGLSMQSFTGPLTCESREIFLTCLTPLMCGTTFVAFRFGSVRFHRP